MIGRFAMAAVTRNPSWVIYNDLIYFHMSSLGYDRMDCDVCGIQNRTQDSSCAMWSSLFAYIYCETGIDPNDITQYIDTLDTTTARHLIESFIYMCYNIYRSSHLEDKVVDMIRSDICSRENICNIDIHRDTMSLLALLLHEVPYNILEDISNINYLSYDGLETLVDSIYANRLCLKIYNALISNLPNSLIYDLLSDASEAFKAIRSTLSWDKMMDIVSYHSDRFILHLSKYLYISGNLHYFYETFLFYTMVYLQNESGNGRIIWMMSLLMHIPDRYDDMIGSIILNNPIWYSIPSMFTRRLSESDDYSYENIESILLSSTYRTVPDDVYSDMKRRVKALI